MCHSPGAAHISRIVSPGLGASTWDATTDGKFWRNAKLGEKPLKHGDPYNDSVMRTAMPLYREEKIRIKIERLPKFLDSNNFLFKEHALASEQPAWRFTEVTLK